MLDSKGFDSWADRYDTFVGESDEGNAYPFARYKELLGGIFQTIMEKPGAAVLDLGFGTGNLAAMLYEKGCDIYGQDYSERMIELASARMPGAHLYQGDFADGLVEALSDRSYDYIVSTYAMHHLTDEQKVSFLHSLLGHLNEGGKILIGDVAFQTREEMARCRQTVGDEWDDDEYYFIMDELKQEFPGITFRPVSFCSGIICIKG